jgi:hypothetical protein
MRGPWQTSSQSESVRALGEGRGEPMPAQPPLPLPPVVASRPRSPHAAARQPLPHLPSPATPSPSDARSPMKSTA